MWKITLTDLLLLFVTTSGIIIALYEFRSYRREFRYKVFLEFRQRFKSDKIILKILKALNTKDKQTLNQLTKYEKYHFLGFYEELEKMYSLKQVTINDIDYFFGYYYIKFFRYTKISRSDYYWRRAIRLYKLIKKHHYINDLKSKE